jgi:hypothetical protein
MIKLIRSLFENNLDIKREEAIKIAKKVCEEKKWPWKEPINVTKGLWNYKIWTNCNMIGGNAIIRIRIKDGKVVSSTITPK